MAGINAAAILTGKPLQSATVGAVLTAPLGTTLPTDATWEPTNAWTSTGYASPDGVSISFDRSTVDIMEWGGSKVRTLTDNYKVQVKYTEIQTDPETMKRVVGEQHVTVTDADQTHGTQMKVGFGPEMPDRCSWVFRMKDGDSLTLLVLPDAQITNLDSFSFVSNDSNKWPVTIDCYDDGTGHSAYLMNDDGVVASG